MVLTFYLRSHMNNKHIRPLGLPSGSIRAIASLVVVIVACQQMLLVNVTPSFLLAETLMIVLTHYFSARRGAATPLNYGLEPACDSTVSTTENPLWLPRGSVRGLITFFFIVTLIMLMQQRRVFDSNALILLGPFSSYLSGAMFRDFINWLWPTDPKAPPSWFAIWYAHLLALYVVLISLLLLVLAVYDIFPVLPNWIQSMLLASILYYFGYR